MISIDAFSRDVLEEYKTPMLTMLAIPTEKGAQLFRVDRVESMDLGGEIREVDGGWVAGVVAHIHLMAGVS